MNSASLNSVFRKSMLMGNWKLSRFAPVTLGLSAVLMLLAGCESTAPAVAAKSGAPVATMRETAPVEPAAIPVQSMEGAGRLPDVITIREGDVLKIAFPGTPQLDTNQQVRTDGVITLDIVGEVKVVGQSPKELEKTLSKMYATQLRSSEVTVVIVSSTFEVYITGAVLRPGKITTNKPITAFQAIMEAGYDPVNSNLEKVTLIRQADRSKYTYISLNLQLVLEGKDTEPFYLKPSDTLQVPKKISIF